MKVAKIMAQEKFEWKFPTEVELSTCRSQLRNIYHISRDFVIEYDLFGENRYFGGPRADPRSSIEKTSDG